MYSYPSPLGQVITNLMMNAFLHAFDTITPGTITVACTADDTNAIIVIEDNGNGIEAKNLPKILDPFFTTKMGSGGTGLGLHICHNITTTILKESISVSSDYTKGTCFKIIMPKKLGDD